MDSRTHLYDEAHSTDAAQNSHHRINNCDSDIKDVHIPAVQSQRLRSCIFSAALLHIASGRTNGNRNGCLTVACKMQVWADGLQGKLTMAAS